MYLGEVRSSEGLGFGSGCGGGRGSAWLGGKRGDFEENRLGRVRH